jgi:hypothetical protein
MHQGSGQYETAYTDASDSDAEIIEIVLHVALNTLTNYVNEVAKTDVDFRWSTRARPPDPFTEP